MRRRRCAHAVLVALVGAARATGGSGAELDARAVALGGSYVLHQLGASPGAALEPGFALQGGVLFAFVGSGLRVQHAGVQRVRVHHAWAITAEQEKSDIHTRTRLGLALQAGTAAWRGGVAFGVASHHFSPYAAWHRLDVRLGMGVRWRRRARFACVGEHVLQRAALPHLAAALSWQLLPRLQAQVQLKREPGVGVRTEAGGVWGEETRVAVLAGFDATTGGVSGGVVAATGPWRLTYGTQSHPELGWSHAWSLEFRR